VGYTAIGVQQRFSSDGERFRVRVQRPDGAWGDGSVDLNEDDALRVLIELGVSEERAGSLLHDAREHGTVGMYRQGEAVRRISPSLS
jgi:hypothetical protein